MRLYNGPKSSFIMTQDPLRRPVVILILRFNEEADRWRISRNSEASAAHRDELDLRDVEGRKKRKGEKEVQILPNRVHRAVQSAKCDLRSRVPPKRGAKGQSKIRAQ